MNEAHVVITGTAHAPRTMCKLLLPQITNDWQRNRISSRRIVVNIPIALFRNETVNPNERNVLYI